MIFTNPKIVIKDWNALEVYMFDEMGFTTDDQVQIKMKSGNLYTMDIESIKPITEARTDDKYKESGWFLLKLKKQKEGE